MSLIIWGFTTRLAYATRCAIGSLLEKGHIVMPPSTWLMLGDSLVYGYMHKCIYLCLDGCIQRDSFVLGDPLVQQLPVHED